MDTKHRILEAALSLFSQKGYANVYVGEIADAVGIKAPSLYKHYKNKQAIFDAILEEMQLRYNKETDALNMDGNNARTDADVFAECSVEELVEMATRLFLYFLHDAYASRFRRMLTIEQFHDRKLAALYDRHYVDGPLGYQGMMFALLTAQGILRDAHTDIMALQFYAPLYLLLTICDRNPDKEAEALVSLREHVEQFSKLYGR